MEIRPEADDAGGNGECHPLFAEAPSSVEFNKLRKRLLRHVRQAIADFAMVTPGERWPMQGGFR